MKKETMKWGVIFVLLLAVTYMPPVQAGQLEPPPGEPGPTMHTLEDIYRQLSILNKRTVFINNETCWNAGYRYCDQHNGTVVDLSTGLVWMKNVPVAQMYTYDSALNFCSNLADGQSGLADGSAAGDWRLPTNEDFGSLEESGYTFPVLHPSYEFAFVNFEFGVPKVYLTSSLCSDVQELYVWDFGSGNGQCYHPDELYFIEPPFITFVWCVK